MRKITIEHYLNKKLKPRYFVSDLPCFPLYVRVSYGRRNERFKSVWITEYYNDEDIQREDIRALIDFESKVIKSLIDISEREKPSDRYTYDKKYVIGNRLHTSLKTMPEWFLENLFDRYEIAKQFVSYVSKHLEIPKEIFDVYYFEFCGYDENKWLCLSEKGFFEGETKDKIYYLVMLLEYERLHFNTIKTVLRAGEIFVFYEWNDNKHQESFLRYAKSRNLISEDVITSITMRFNSTILNLISFSDIFERS